jgi:hypothetical protein
LQDIFGIATGRNKSVNVSKNASLILHQQLHKFGRNIATLTGGRRRILGKA